MRKKEYISPACDVIKMTYVVLQSTSPNPLIDPNKNTGDALAPSLEKGVALEPFLETDDF